MKQQSPVPRLDLAPKLKRPLALWNPLDYLRLLYWVFYFPQALRWYVDTFGGGYIPEGEIIQPKESKLLSRHLIIRQLLIQASVLISVGLLTLVLFVFAIMISIDWLSIALGVPLGIFTGFSLTLGLVVLQFRRIRRPTYATWGLFLGGAASGAISSSSLSATLCVTWGLTSAIVFGMSWWVMSELYMLRLVPPWVEFATMFGVTLGLVRMESDIVFGFASGIISSGLILRIDSWLLGLIFALRSRQNKDWKVPHVTSFSVPFLFSDLKNWLEHDWEIGLYNANQLLDYTVQFIPVVDAVNHVLGVTPPEQVIFRIAQLSQDPYDCKLVYFMSSDVLEVTLARRSNIRLDTPAPYAAAGFWYLHEKQPAKAMKAFAVVHYLPYGEEMFILAETLTAFDEAKTADSIATVQIPSFPQEPLLRPTTWATLTSLKQVVENAQLVLLSTSRFQRSSALNRALGELKTILNNKESLPNAERDLIVNIAQTWQEALLNVAGEVGEIVITEPVNNPYVAGNPVQGNLFVGREDVIRQLKELWVTSHQLQSVVIYGHRRMGKTSILRNVANFVSADVQIAYVNLLEVGDAPEGVAEVMMAICDAISEVVQIPPPSNEDLLSLPLPTFRRYLEQVEKKLGEKGLIIALDEFEQIEKLIEAGKIPKDFMGYLRGLAHKSSKIAFALAGLHTLEEMTSDYFQPFYASVITIRVGFIEAGATQEILANPAIDDFPLDYTPEALDKIYDLTHGQPYLVQLVGFQLVRRYNDQVFTMRNRRNPVFTVEDVEAVIKDVDFFKNGSGYFTGVWGQAVRGAVGQHDILRILAPHPQGLTLDALSESTNMDEATLQEALKTLTRHDVVKEVDGCWRIIVELFRLWLLQL